jgi:hypothetical protein
MESELRFTRDGVQYVMTPANAMASWKALKRAASLLKGVDVEEIKAGDHEGKTSVAIGTLLANLGEPAVAEIESIVFASTAVQPSGGDKPYRLEDSLDSHFNKHRAHLIPVLVQGVKYQYTDFFAGGMAMLQDLLPAKKKAQSTEQTGSSSPQ